MTNRMGKKQGSGSYPKIRGGAGGSGLVRYPTQEIVPLSLESYKVFMYVAFVMFALILFMIYQLYNMMMVHSGSNSNNNTHNTHNSCAKWYSFPYIWGNPANGSNTRGDNCHSSIFTDPYVPPMNRSQLGIPPPVHMGVPVNIPTRGPYVSEPFTQLGILTREDGGGSSLILPLMGRSVDSGRNKYQYYTISNTGAVNTKLQVRVKQRICTNEYGCDELYNGDVVYVQGYNETFRVTMYENATLTYLPNVL